MTEVFILNKRKDFVKVASQGQKMVSSSLILQAAFHIPAVKPIPGGAGLGYTVTKKIGKAHVRNRTKRRLRAAAREIFPRHSLPGVSYVLIGRHNTASCNFAKLKEEMIIALKRINKILKKEKSANEKTPDPAADSAD